MRRLKLAVPAAFVLGGFLLVATQSYGTQEIAKKEGKSCVTCHAKMEGKEAMKKNLNAVGSCYKEKSSMTECSAPKK